MDCLEFFGGSGEGSSSAEHAGRDVWDEGVCGDAEDGVFRGDLELG